MRTTLFRRPRLLLSLGLSSLLFSCGDGGAPSADSANAVTSNLAVSSAVASGAAPASAPSTVPAGRDLVAAVPADATIVVHLPAPTELGLDPASIDGIRMAAPLVALQAGIPTPMMEAILDGFEGATVAVSGSANSWETNSAPVRAVIKLKNQAAFDFFANHFTKVSEGRYTYAPSPDETLQIEWLADRRLALVAMSPESLTGLRDVVLGKAPSFATGKTAKLVAGSRAFAIGDLTAIMGDPSTFDTDSVAAMWNEGTIGSTTSTVIYRQFGAKVPRLSAVLSPTSHDAMGLLPDGALFALDVSLARKTGGIPAFLAEIARAAGTDPTPALTGELAKIGLDLPKLEAVLGDSLTLGAYSDATNPLEMQTKMAVVLTLAIKDEAIAGELWALAQKSAPPGAKFKGRRVELALDANTTATVELGNGALRVIVGSKTTVATIEGRIKAGKSLGANADYVATLPSGRPSAVRAYADFKRMSALNPSQSDLGAMGPSLSDVVIIDSDRGVDVELKGGGAMVPIVGVLGAVGAFGFQRYVERARAAQSAPPQPQPAPAQPIYK